MRFSHFLSSVPLGRFRARTVLALSIVVMLGLCIVDIVTPTDIRLHVLYVFPLAAIAYHCPQVWMPVLGFVVAIIAQLLTVYLQQNFKTVFIIDGVLAVASSTLAVVLSRRLRASYIAIAQLADTDALTGLYNRRRFQSVIDAELRRQVRYGGVFSILAIDLNDFKRLNDTEGHHAGDQALVLLARTLQANTRKTDCVARLGGDEFAILMPQTTDENCAQVRKQLSIEIERAMISEGFSISASIGYVAFKVAPGSASAALQAADREMYKVKVARKSSTI
ncbi:GGDEF domain-containing protein [Rugamonas apoptosis]|uniref:diguanylate cyclase n=1 Tax=Rugamonas apoptosis TaxID=2758570 RepID=A0A7W2FDZ6_9BURK|nr:GGDEF domain-containing protein [Rugamonas apoptosis]MBA5689992.1 GGDEF domain-containing protein [Rugamonas apoptosis]